MPKARRVVLLTALCALALVLAAPAGGQTDSAWPAPDDLYWLGPYFGGLELTDSRYRTFAYGECEFPEGEGGCTLPVQVQNATSCAQNPVAEGAGLEQEVFLVRGGGLAVAYGEGEVDLGTGRQTLTLRAHEPEVLGAMLREARRRSETGPQPLAPPVYPLPVLRELVRVTAAAKRFDGVATIARATELSPEDVEMRLRIAELLGPDALAGVPAPTMSIATVERLRQLAWGVETHDLAHTAERHKMSIATLRGKIARVRGLAGPC